MAFNLHKSDFNGTMPLEYLPGKAGESYAPGEALAVASGAVTKCGATTAPAYLCAGKLESAAEGTLVPAVRVSRDRSYRAPLSAAGTALKVGDKVTLSADGLGVTATTASGVAEITEIFGTAVGDEVAVRF